MMIPVLKVLLEHGAATVPAAVASALELGKMLSEKLVKLFAADVTKALVQTEPLEPHFHAHLEGLLAQLGLGTPAAKEEPPLPSGALFSAARRRVSRGTKVARAASCAAQKAAARTPTLRTRKISLTFACFFALPYLLSRRDCGQ